MDHITMVNSPLPHCGHGLIPFLSGRGVVDESTPLHSIEKEKGIVMEHMAMDNSPSP